MSRLIGFSMWIRTGNCACVRIRTDSDDDTVRYDTMEGGDCDAVPGWRSPEGAAHAPIGLRSRSIRLVHSWRRGAMGMACRSRYRIAPREELAAKGDQVDSSDAQQHRGRFRNGVDRAEVDVCPRRRSAWGQACRHCSLYPLSTLRCPGSGGARRHRSPRLPVLPAMATPLAGKTPAWKPHPPLDVNAERSIVPEPLAITSLPACAKLKTNEASALVLKKRAASTMPQQVTPRDNCAEMRSYWIVEALD